MQNPITSIVRKLRHIIIAGERNSKSKKSFSKKAVDEYKGRLYNRTCQKDNNIPSNTYIS
ncbi:hypothetical protein EAI05_10910 [Bacillus subtilis]|nr:hypothetical protein B6K89_16265 [Bacillus subtilis]PAC86190.1 hypothetical protein CHI03_07970 [Bacillus subtilis]PAE68986.1 hypothetical protein CHH85_06965 [Bacillus subtilis]QFY81521.1 hypothetical protein D0808_09125 [Bacillus subtilis]RNA71960.1 hypothetical protein EAI05_10910 [Bacillus subtilis]